MEPIYGLGQYFGKRKRWIKFEYQRGFLMMIDIYPWLEKTAKRYEFDEVRIAEANLSNETQQHLRDFLNNGYHGEMAWLEQTIERRLSPKNIWQNARTAIIFAKNYGPDHNPMDNILQYEHGNISVYARSKDYHSVMKGRLKQIASQFVSKFKGEVKVFVDTAPIMEKPLAVKSGIGWQGKHTNLVSQKFGSWLFLGVILTDAELAIHNASEDLCGTCQKCLDICPTNAFPAPYKLDARRCISYLTIEFDGIIDTEYRKPIGNRIFGCDDCLAVCPWNKFAQTAYDARMQLAEKPGLLPLSMLLSLTESGFRELFSGTPVRRAGYKNFMRNCLIAAGNSSDQSLIPIIHSYVDDEVIAVKIMAIWALRQLCNDDQFQQFKRQHSDTEPELVAEWSAVI